MTRADHFLIRVIESGSLLNWNTDGIVDDDDLMDAIDHVNLMRHRRMEKSLGDVEEQDELLMDPRKLLQAVAFKSKPYGWLALLPRSEWVTEFKKVYNRDIANILSASKGSGISPAIVVEDELGDGFARALLAYSLGELVNVMKFGVAE